MPLPQLVSYHEIPCSNPQHRGPDSIMLTAGRSNPFTHLGEQAPPLPVAQLEVGCTVALHDLEGTHLLLLFHESPGTKKNHPTH